MVIKGRVSLSELKDGCSAAVVAYQGGSSAAKRLADLGLTPGTVIRVVRKTLFAGPVQVEVRGSQLVLGRGLATKIIVRVL